MDRCEKMTSCWCAWKYGYPWLKQSKYILYIYLEWCICTYLTNNIWFKNVGKICAMTNLPKPPLVDVKQYSVWQFALGNSFMTQSPITPSSQQISGHTIWCIVSQHYVEVLLPSAYISICMQIDSWWYLIICVCACTGCIASVLVFRQLVPHKPEHTWSHESKGKQAKQSRQAIFKVIQQQLWSDSNSWIFDESVVLPFRRHSPLWGWSMNSGQCIVLHVANFIAIT